MAEVIRENKFKNDNFYPMRGEKFSVILIAGVIVQQVTERFLQTK